MEGKIKIIIFIIIIIIADGLKSLGVVYIHCKKRLAIFPSPAGMSPTKPSLAGDTLIFPQQREFG
jgi:hypothetical protein